MLMALPTGKTLAEWIADVNKAAEKGRDFLLTVKSPPKGLHDGAKCYVISDDKVQGFVGVIDVLALSDQRLHYMGQKLKAGWYVVLRGPFLLLEKPVPQHGFNGYRYCEEF